MLVFIQVLFYLSTFTFNPPPPQGDGSTCSIVQGLRGGRLVGGPA